MSQGRVESDRDSRVLPPHLPTFWWLEKGSYFTFVLREMSCVFVAWFAVYLLLLVRAVGQGAAAYQAYLAWSASGPIVLLNLVSLAFLILHAVSFFDAAPRAMVVKLGQSPVPPSLVLAGHYAGLVVASAIVAWLLLGA